MCNWGSHDASNVKCDNREHSVQREMTKESYGSVVGSSMYIMIFYRLDIAQEVRTFNKSIFNLGKKLCNFVPMVLMMFSSYSTYIILLIKIV